MVVRGNVSGFGFVPAGLRAGGTTHLVLHGAEIGRVQFLGRWRATQTLQSYIQEAMSALVWHRFPMHTKALIQTIVIEGSGVLRFPPTLGVVIVLQSIATMGFDETESPVAILKALGKVGYGAGTLESTVTSATLARKLVRVKGDDILTQQHRAYAKAHLAIHNALPLHRCDS